MKTRFLIVGALLSLATLAQADVKISNLPAGTTLGGTEPIPAVQSATTVRTTPDAISTYTVSQITSGTVTGKFSGVCDITTFLRGDGACSLLSLTSNVSGVLPVANGGIGAGTLTGVAKGNGTSAFTAAASTDVIGLWTGTCNSGTFLKGDGSCGTGGSVTSVAMTVPSWLSVAGSPVTSSGTLAVTAAGSQTANQFVATPNGSTGAVSLRAIAAGDLPAINLAASGAGGVTGVLTSANGGAVSTVAKKAADTSRTSTTTVTIDPDLQFASKPAGTYNLSCVLYFSSSVASQAAKFGISSTGTVTFGQSTVTALDTLSTCAGAAPGGVMLAVNGNTGSTFNGCPSNSSTSAFTINASIVTSGTGTIGVSWAQLNSNATALTAKAGSYCELF